MLLWIGHTSSAWALVTADDARFRNAPSSRAVDRARRSPHSNADAFGSRLGSDLRRDCVRRADPSRTDTFDLDPDCDAVRCFPWRMAVAVAPIRLAPRAHALHRQLFALATRAWGGIAISLCALV